METASIAAVAGCYRVDHPLLWRDRRSTRSRAITSFPAARLFEMTFVLTTPRLPPVMRIDRSLTGPHAVDARIRSEVGMGRGPRDLIATVAFPPT